MYKDKHGFYVLYTDSSGAAFVNDTESIVANHLKHQKVLLNIRQLKGCADSKRKFQTLFIKKVKII